jgi:alpha-glucosidase (family GH31 glycosyl hydrolase)
MWVESLQVLHDPFLPVVRRAETGTAPAPGRLEESTLPRVRSVLAAALLAAALAPAARAAETVDAGALRAGVDADPWRLTLTDADGGLVLGEHPGTGAGPTGTLGARTLAGWAHATRVATSRRDGQAYEGELETTDPLRRISFRIEPDADGVIRLVASAPGAEAVGIGFGARDGERYLGFGERANAIDQRGREVENYVSDGPFQEEERPFVGLVTPTWAKRDREDATYFPVPWLLSTAGYGVLVDNVETSWYRLASEQPDAWSVEAEAAELSLRFFAGPRPADALRRFTERTGRQPRAAAPWFFGPWFQTGQRSQVPLEQEMDYLRRLNEADAPVSVAETHMRYLPCGDAQGRREGERARTAFFHEQGLAVLTYFNAFLCEEYRTVFDEAAARGFLQRRQTGQPYTFPAYQGGRSPPTAQQANWDFTAPGVEDLYARLLGEAIEDGHDGWMEDFGEYTPPDAVSHAEPDGSRMHNRYPVPFHCTIAGIARRQSRPLARFSRSGWTGAAPCVDIVWGGDPTTDWGFDGLASVLTTGMNMGLSGISTWGSDIGGFFSLGTRALTPELLIRWIQAGALTPVMRTKAEGFALPEKPRPQIWEPEIIGHWRRWAKLHTQLNPYLRAAESEYRRSGLPIMRHLALVFPGDPAAVAREDEYMLGPDLLAAPVLEPGARTRRLYVPRGRWVDLWRAVRYRQADGGLGLRRARAFAGGGERELPAPLEESPLLVRAGAVIPLLPAAVDRLSDYGPARGHVQLRDRRRRLDLLAFPRGRSRAASGGGERFASVERRGRWRLRVSGRSVRRYRLQASMATLRRPLRPCAVSFAGQPVSRRAWRYNRRTRVLRARFRARTGTLTVRSGC